MLIPVISLRVNSVYYFLNRNIDRRHSQELFYYVVDIQLVHLSDLLLRITGAFYHREHIMNLIITRRDSLYHRCRGRLISNLKVNIHHRHIFGRKCLISNLGELLQLRCQTYGIHNIVSCRKHAFCTHIQGISIDKQTLLDIVGQRKPG